MKLRVLILTSLLSITFAWAETANVTIQPTATPPITQAQSVDFETCTKMFPINKERLFYLTLASVTANKFSIDEIQTNNGYIIFSAVNKKFLATIAGIDADNAILKITPCNDIYFFPPGVFLGMYKYIEMNLNTEIR